MFSSINAKFWVFEVCEFGHALELSYEHFEDFIHDAESVMQTIYA